MSRLARHLIVDILRSSVPVPRGAFRAPRPFKLTFVLTERCHHRCTLCRLWEERPARGPSLEEIDRFFSTNPTFSWINLTGGELVARPDIDEVLACLLETQRRLEILQFPTAGWLPERTERLVRDLLARGVPRLVVTVSLDGDQATHDRLRGRVGAHQRAIETLARLTGIRNRRFEVLAGITLSPLNAEAVAPAIEELCHGPFGLDRDHIHVNMAHHSPHYYRNAPLPPLDASALPRLPVRLRSLLRPTRLVETLYRRLLPLYLSTGRCPVPCQASRVSLFVGADLEVYPCSTWDASFGNLRDAAFDLQRLLAAPSARAIRKQIAARRCPGCWTPCDAAPTIAARLPEAVLRALRPAPSVLPAPLQEPLAARPATVPRTAFRSKAGRAEVLHAVGNLADSGTRIDLRRKGEHPT